MMQRSGLWRNQDFPVRKLPMPWYWFGTLEPTEDERWNMGRTFLNGSKQYGIRKRLETAHFAKKGMTLKAMAKALASEESGDGG
jgi:hypothetical protein